MANWKNPFHQKQDKENQDNDNQDEDGAKKGKKDVRVSCEAIPEEIAGIGGFEKMRQERQIPNGQQDFWSKLAL